MIAEVIRQVLVDLEVVDPVDVNNGNCEAFADLVASRVPGARVLWDWEAPSKTDPANDFAWVHCFIHYEGKFYDSECPDGVEDWTQLPLFVRHLAIHRTLRAFQKQTPR